MLTHVNACDILKKRFSDSQVVIQANMDVLTGLEVVRSIKDLNKLRKMYDTIEIHTRNLDVLNVKVEEYGSILVTLIMNKVPDELQD